MIATKRFVFLHLHKSGGTFVNEWLLRFFPDARELGYHLPRKLIPPPLAALPVIGLVRNPWSYYVSWHAFQATRRQPNALFQILSNGGQVGFEGTIRNMLELGGASALLDRIVGALPASYVGKGLIPPDPSWPRSATPGSGSTASSTAICMAAPKRPGSHTWNTCVKSFRLYSAPRVKP